MRVISILMALAISFVAVTGYADDKKPTSKPARVSKSPYPLDTCAVTGEKLGGMGDPVVLNYKGREVRFCCKMCVGKFKKDAGKYLAGVDKRIIAQQAAYYPVDKCVVSGESFDEADGKPVDMVFQNRLVRLCCKMCKRDFSKNPERFLKKLDAAIVAKQGKSYPLDTCVITGEKLGGMGKPHEMIIGNRLVRLCCKGCEKKVLADPAAALAKLDAAKKKK